MFEKMNTLAKTKRKKAIISVKQERNNQVIYNIHFIADIVVDEIQGFTLEVELIQHIVQGYDIGLQKGKRYLVDMEFDYVNLRPKFSNPDSQDNMVYYNFINSGKDIQKSLNVQKRWARYRKNQDTKKEKECVEQPLRPPVQENKSEQHIQELEIDPKHKHVQKIIEKKKQERESKRNTGQAEIDVDALLEGFEQHLKSHQYQKEEKVINMKSSEWTDEQKDEFLDDITADVES